MQVWNRALRWLAVLASVAVIAAACSQVNPSPSPSPSPGPTQVPASPAASVSPSAAPATTPPSGEEYRIAIVAPLNIELFQQEERGAQAAAAAFGVKLEYTYTDPFTLENYISSIKSAIATKPDAIGFGFYTEGFTQVTDEALAEGIKVVFINGTPQNFPAFGDPKYLNIGFSGANERAQSATLAGKFIEFLTSKGKIVLINNAPANPDHRIRVDSAKAIFEAAGYTTEELAGSQDTAVAVANVGAYLQANPDVVGAYTTGFNSAQAVCTFTKQNNLTIPVSTFDADPNSLQAIKDGCISVLIDQQFFLEGFYGLTNAYHSLEYGTQPVFDNTGTYLITRDNVDSYPKN